MKITESDHRLPILITPHEAAVLFATKEHLVLFSPRGGRQERMLHTVTDMLPPAQCHLLAIQARYAPHMPTPVLTFGGDPMLPERLLLFVRDDLPARLTVLACFAKEFGIESAQQNFSRPETRQRGLCLLLEGESRTETERLMFDYGLIVNTLESILESPIPTVSDN